MVFVESLDLLLAACEDACIYVWGIDEEGVRILRGMDYKENRSEFDDNDPLTQEYVKNYMRMHSARDRDSFDINDSVVVVDNAGVNTSTQTGAGQGDIIEQQEQAAEANSTEHAVSASRLEKSTSPRKTASSVKNQEAETATNRVAGFVLKKILCEHSSCVTSLVVVERPSKI